METVGLLRGLSGLRVINDYWDSAQHMVNVQQMLSIITQEILQLKVNFTISSFLMAAANVDLM